MTSEILGAEGTLGLWPGRSTSRGLTKCFKGMRSKLSNPHEDM